MAAKEPTAERNLDGYGAPVIPWTKVRERLEAGVTQAPGTGGPNRHTCWLGPPPWHLYEVTPATVFALGTAEPYGATRWRF
jgi:hypothetical protein